jgi:hypothetical protein
MNSSNYWRTTPRKLKFIFLLAFFLVFAGVGFTDDVVDMGVSLRYILHCRFCSLDCSPFPVPPPG